MRVLVFGAKGQLGRDCVTSLQATNYDVFACARDEVDFSEPESVARKIYDAKADIVVNACAYTAVDKAEEEPALAGQVNHLSVATMASACNDLDIPLIHISTDYVFDGTGHEPYVEDMPVNPLGIYGMTKLAGEQAIQQKMSRYIILRTSWVFGEHGNNFVKTMLRIGENKDTLRVVNDQYGRPTYVGDLVQTILFFINQYSVSRTLPWGIYHCASEGEVSWYHFAKAIFEMATDKGLLKTSPDVQGVTSKEYFATMPATAVVAPRPAYSVLSTNKLNALMGRNLGHWRDGLLLFLSQQILSKESISEN